MNSSAARRRLRGGQRVEDDPARVALDEADVGEVVAAHLVDATRHHLVEAVSHVEHGLALQRGMDAREVLAREQPLVAAHVPGDVARVGHDLLVRRLGDEALLRFVEVALVAERQLGLEAVADLERESRRWLALRIKVRRWVGCLRRGRGASEAQGERHAQRTDRVHAGSMQVAGRREVPPVGPAETATGRLSAALCARCIAMIQTCIPCMVRLRRT